MHTHTCVNKGFTPARELARVALLAGPILLILFLGLDSGSAMAAAQAFTCPAELMEHECTQYRQRLDQAGSREQRKAIEHEYWSIIQDRRQACRCFDESKDSMKQSLRFRGNAPKAAPAVFLRMRGKGRDGAKPYLVQAPVFIGLSDTRAING
ncbi:MAG: hypothetical protein HGA75_04620 [Thiobacillus sp.]|nr:hypothetical protein [Thiobacillus sp.]